MSDIFVRAVKLYLEESDISVSEPGKDKVNR